MKIAVLIKKQNKKASFYSQKIVDFLLSLKIEILTLKENEDILKNFVKYADSTKELVKNSDIVLTVGGDGTLIDAASCCARFEKPILGINLGRVGFVATLEKDEISKLNFLVDKNFVLNKRSLISIKHGIEEYKVINDIVFSKKEPLKIGEFCIEYRGEKFNYRADALMFSTPTGSTAHSFSAGGPIIDPSLNCILMSQICPFSLFSRSVIFSGNDEILIHPKEKIVATIDGNHKIELNERFIKIKISDVYLKIISFEKQNFYKIFKDKFKNLGDN